MLFLRCQVHPSLIINMDQTGVRLVPAATHTYETAGSSAVCVVGKDDKRQITACVASAMNGSMLPLQLVFEGKTSACLPEHTPTSRAAQVHLTFSPNHWSSLTTMKQFVSEVIMPYATRCIDSHQLRADENIILVLDVWAVHKSAEFRQYLKEQHPRIHLVYVPANCTSKLQVADVALQKPFKSAINAEFDLWAALQIKTQLDSHAMVGFCSKSFGTSVIKPNVLEWCVTSWTKLLKNKALVLHGWKVCCTDMYDVNDPVKRIQALEMMVQEPEKLKQDEVLAGIEPDPVLDEESDHEDDEDNDQLDTAKNKAEGSRKSTRARKQSAPRGYMLDSEHVHISEDSDA